MCFRIWYCRLIIVINCIPWHANTSFTDVQWILVKRAVGLGLAMMPVSTAGMNTIPKQLAARASAINNVVRQIAGSFGIALITYVMMHRQVYHNAWLSETLNWSSSATIISIKNLAKHGNPSWHFSLFRYGTLWCGRVAGLHDAEASLYCQR